MDQNRPWSCPVSLMSVVFIPMKLDTKDLGNNQQTCSHGGTRAADLQRQEEERHNSKHSDGLAMILFQNLNGLLDIIL